MDLQPMWTVMTSSPWILLASTALVAYVGSRLFLRLRWLPLALRGRDPQRRFAGPTRAAVLARAGHRCEHQVLLLWRCPATSRLEVDHVHPHSRGGSTSLSNGQTLCAMHNRQKGARIPFTWELRLLTRRRARYAPPGMPTTVTRRGN